MTHHRTLAILATTFAMLAAAGCAVTRDQQSVGAIDDTAITTAVKSRMVDSGGVDASAISVETLNGTVMLSGFAKNATERSAAESMARKTGGVKVVKNEIAIRP